MCARLPAGMFCRSLVAFSPCEEPQRHSTGDRESLTANDELGHPDETQQVVEEHSLYTQTHMIEYTHTNNTGSNTHTHLIRHTHTHTLAQMNMYTDTSTHAHSAMHRITSVIFSTKTVTAMSFLIRGHCGCTRSVLLEFSSRHSMHD